MLLKRVRVLMSNRLPSPSRPLHPSSPPNTLNNTSSPLPFACQQVIGSHREHQLARCSRVRIESRRHRYKRR